MNEEKKLDDLTLDLNMDLCVLNSAVNNCDNLEVCCLTNFVERLYKTSEDIRDIFINFV